MVILAGAVVFGVVRLGIPVLAKLAIFLADKSPDETKETSIVVPPVLNALPEATNSGELVVSGFTTEGLRVTLYLNGKAQKEIGADEDGEFELDLTLRNGSNRISAQAADDKGNQSQKSEEMTVVLDQSDPEIIIDEPEAVVHEKIFRAEGMVDESVSLMINGRLATQKSDNSFSATVNLNQGENEIEIIATDRAGNITRKILRVSFEE